MSWPWQPIIHELYLVEPETAIMTHLYLIDAPGLGMISGAAFEDEAQ